MQTAAIEIDIFLVEFGKKTLNTLKVLVSVYSTCKSIEWLLQLAVFFKNLPFINGGVKI